MEQETIEVRPDERFDEVKLAGYLRGRLPGGERPLTVRQFGGGAANLTYLLDYGAAQYVLRRPPLGPVAASAHDMGREFRVLSVLHQAFPPAPRALLYEPDPAIIGAPFLLLEQRRGVVIRRRLPPAWVGQPDALHRLSQALVDTLVAFHAVDYAALGLGDLGEPAGFVDRQIEGWYRRWQAAQTVDAPEMGAVYGWLKAHRPATTAFSLVHNDYKLDNVMLDPADPGRVTAVFDWDMCTLGDPLSDLGALLTYWTEPDDSPPLPQLATMPVGQPGFWPRAELVARYAAQSGRSVDQISFYHTLGLFRVTVIIAQIYVRYVRGQTQDERFASLGQMIRPMAQAAAAVANEAKRL